MGWGRLVLAVVAALALAGVSVALARDVTRAEYIAQVDPICKRTDARLRPTTHKFIHAIHTGHHRAAGRALYKGVRIYARSLRKVGAVTPPAADARRIARWLAWEHKDVGVTKRMAAAELDLRIDDYNDLVRRSRAIERHIDATLKGYGFKRCN